MPKWRQCPIAIFFRTQRWTKEERFIWKEEDVEKGWAGNLGTKERTGSEEKL